MNRVGGALIEYACDWSKSKGTERLTVGVIDDNHAALVLYRVAGFINIGRTKPELTTLEGTILQRYNGLECFDTWRWVLLTGEGFVHHTAESLEMNLKK